MSLESVVWSNSYWSSPGRGLHLSLSYLWLQPQLVHSLVLHYHTKHLKGLTLLLHPYCFLFPCLRPWLQRLDPPNLFALAHPGLPRSILSILQIVLQPLSLHSEATFPPHSSTLSSNLSSLLIFKAKHALCVIVAPGRHSSVEKNFTLRQSFHVLLSSPPPSPNKWAPNPWAPKTPPLTPDFPHYMASSGRPKGKYCAFPSSSTLT